MPNFYEKMNSFKDFKNLLNNENYLPIPKDWFIVLTDIQGSTKAVSEGKYKDVNMVGSMAIVAILNKIKQSIPFAFGGDGSTIFIPPESYLEVLSEMQNCIFIAQNNFKLNLRVAIIPLSEIYNRGGKVEVAKYELSDKNYIAQFKGGGIDIAEALTKAPDSTFLIKEKKEYPNLNGLTCRWSPLKSDKGVILTLIIKTQAKEKIDNFLEYLKFITNSESLKDLSPVKFNKLTASWPPPIHLEAKANATKNNYFKIYLETLIINFLVYLFVKLNLETKDFSMLKYKKEILTNADYKKYDDTLRLVIDCSKEEAKNIISYLEYQEVLKVLEFGYHFSKEAVMTCMVFSKENNEHIHFIDGSGGGYTLAAKIMKEKRKVLMKSA